MWFLSCSDKELVDVVSLAEDSQVVLLLSHPQQVCLQGKMKIRSLYGAVDILGYILTDKNQDYPVFSPESNSLVTMATIAASGPFHREAIISDIVQQVGEQNKELIQNIRDKVTDSTVALLVKKLDCDTWDYISSFHPYQQHLFSLHSKDRVTKSIQLGRLDVQIRSDAEYEWRATDEYKKAAHYFCMQLQDKGETTAKFSQLSIFVWTFCK